MHIVAVPGVGLDQRAYEATVRYLDGRVSVLRLPGFGLPASDVADLSPPRLAEAVRSELARRAVVDVVLLAHSAGCQIVANAAGDKRVVGVVLVSPTTDPRAGSWPGLAGRWLWTARHEYLRLVPSLTAQYSTTGLVSMVRAMEAARHYDIREPLRRNEKPLVVVRGEYDAIAPPEWVKAVAEAGSGRAATIPGGGHMVVMTDGAGVADQVRAVVGAASAR
ncbi:MAG: alpha/beta fold hydrolase [Actinomycetes bacterium]